MAYVLMSPVFGYLKTFDPNIHDRRYAHPYPTGEVRFTESVAEAMRFPSFTDAMRFYRTVSKIAPLRPDGFPNRPLTAFSMAIEPVTD